MQNQIPKTWRKVKLEDVVEFVDGDRGVNYPKSDELLHSGHCLFLNTKNVPGVGFNFSNSDKQFITKDKDESLRKGKLKRGDFVLTTRGTVGNIAYYSNNVSYENIRINSGMVILRKKSSTLNTGYFRQFLSGKDFNSQIQSLISGSAQPQLPIRDLSQIELTLPPVAVQKRIACILSAFDDKIEVNNKIAKTLEQMAQTIFKEWFVKLRFPGYRRTKFVESELGKIPKGWRNGNFLDIAEVNPLTKLNRFQAAPYVEMKDLSEDSMWFSFGRKRKYKGSGSKFINYDTLLARITPCLENGKTGYTQCLSDNLIGWGSTEFLIFRAKNSYLREYVYLLSRSRHFRGYAIGAMIGSSGRQRVPAESIEKYQLAVPSKALTVKFHASLEPCFSEITLINKENQKLAAMRDLLLPKIMKGEINI
jgi:type I restriction enzyme S subunit